MAKNIREVELFLFDLDGTVYIGDKEIEGSFAAVNKLREMGKRICFFTNNSSRMHTDYIARLNNLGLRVYADEIYTSGQVTCEYLLDNYRGKKVYLLGNDRLRAEFEPDVGAMLSAIKLTVGREPDLVMGKPHKTAGQRIALKYNLPPRKIAMVGDRLYTDIAFGRNCGFVSVLVLSGETSAEDVARSKVKPDYVLNAVREIPALLE